MKKTHRCVVRPDGVKCSCGYSLSTFTGSAALRRGYIHASECSTNVIDLRLCTKMCRNIRGERGFVWHHPQCANHIIEPNETGEIVNG